jgi:uncharacterized protein YigA (DUF484 family)
MAMFTQTEHARRAAKGGTMEGCHTTRVSPTRDLPDDYTQGDEQSHNGPARHGDGEPEISNSGAVAGPTDRQASFCVDDASNFLDEMDDSGLLRSFDKVFQFHQRSEELRNHLDKIDGILLTSRTTSELVERLINALQAEMDLTAARFLFRQDNPIASLVRRAQSDSVAVVPNSVFEDERFTQANPFILDYPSDSLGISLFGESWNKVCSAAVANLDTQTEKIGALCLGSRDRNHYRTDRNTNLLASLAEKIAAGLINARDHETSASRAIFDGPDRVHSEGFFQEYLQKEFYRAWRGESSFALMAVASKPVCGAESTSLEQVSEVVAQNIRSADLLSRSGSNDLWILLPATALHGARTVAERLIDAIDTHFHSAVVLHIGIAGFSQDTTVITLLMDQARNALEHAALNETHQIEVQTIQEVEE